MKILYCKLSNKRRRKFQIKTKIVITENGKEVWKEPFCEEAEAHIKNMMTNRDLLAPLYKDACSEYSLYENVLRTPFFETEETLSTRLKYSLDNNDEFGIKKNLDELKKYIIGNESNECLFTNSKEQEEIFGKRSELEGLKAVKISNFDLNPDNVLFDKDGNTKIIDYEWVFVFPLPVDFILYYAIRVFTINHNESKNFNKLLEYVNIDEGTSNVFEEMIEAFNEYVVNDPGNGVNYINIGREFLEPTYDFRDVTNNLKYTFDETIIPEKSKLIIYGAGNVGTDYYAFATASGRYDVVGWTDKRADSIVKHRDRIIKIQDIKNIKYDYILIGVLKEKVAEEIRSELIGQGINKKKIIWVEPKCL